MQKVRADLTISTPPLNRGPAPASSQPASPVPQAKLKEAQKTALFRRSPSVCEELVQQKLQKPRVGIMSTQGRGLTVPPPLLWSGWPRRKKAEAGVDVRSGSRTKSQEEPESPSQSSSCWVESLRRRAVFKTPSAAPRQRPGNSRRGSKGPLPPL